jgi:hypothetical protein
LVETGKVNVCAIGLGGNAGMRNRHAQTMRFRKSDLRVIRNANQQVLSVLLVSRNPDP